MNEAGQPATEQPSAPVPDIPPGCEMARNWSVHVEVAGQSILSLSDHGYSGLGTLEPWESTIRGCASHLIAFVGDSRSAAPAAAWTPALDWQPDHGDRESADLFGWHFETVYTKGTLKDRLQWHVSVLCGGSDDWAQITSFWDSAAQAKADAERWVSQQLPRLHSGQFSAGEARGKGTPEPAGYGVPDGRGGFFFGRRGAFSALPSETLGSTQPFYTHSMPQQRVVEPRRALVIELVEAIKIDAQAQAIARGLTADDWSSVVSSRVRDALTAICDAGEADSKGE